LWSTRTQKIAEINALVPFSTPTGDTAQNPSMSDMAINANCESNSSFRFA